MIIYREETKEQRQKVRFKYNYLDKMSIVIGE